DGHRLARALHRRAELELDVAELLVGPSRDFGHDVVDRRLEGGGRLAGDLVVDLVETLAERDLRRDACDGIARRLGGERRRARDASVDLDDTVFAAGRPVVAPGELDVTAALNAEIANHVERVGAHLLVTVVRNDL